LVGLAVTLFSTNPGLAWMLGLLVGRREGARADLRGYEVSL